MTARSSIRATVILIAFGLGLAACGSSSGGAANTNPDGGGIVGGAGLTWKDDGVAHRAGFASATLGGSSLTQLLEIGGGEATGIGIALGISTPPPLVMGSYTCTQTGGNPIVSFTYSAPGVGPVSSACMINLTAPGDAAGAHATGTFSATFPLTAGGTKSITDGSFDLPVQVFSI